MGGCVGKGHAKDNGIAEQDRRRLSVSKAEKRGNAESSEASAGGDMSGGGAADGGVAELFPRAMRRASLRGISAETSQKSYTDKATIRGGDESLLGVNVGVACKKGHKPESPNQDDFCVLFADDTRLFSVFDGHGPYGHDLSSFVQENLPRCFVKDPSFQSDPERALEAAFPDCHRMCTEAQTERHFDCTLSGTTATLAMQRDGKFYVAHVGDTRVVLARKVDGEIKAEDLTKDHKPTLEGERARIQSAGGQVRRLEGDIPHRVFLAGKMYPGLAMTRSIGDTVGAVAGVSCIPEVASFNIGGDWRFVLIGSDGIWEFISSQEAVDFIAKFPPSNVHKAVESLAAEAWRRWREEEGDVVDDITILCVWIHED